MRWTSMRKARRVSRYVRVSGLIFGWSHLKINLVLLSSLQKLNQFKDLAMSNSGGAKLGINAAAQQNERQSCCPVPCHCRRERGIFKVGIG